jgi:hypothetical protein
MACRAAAGERAQWAAAHKTRGYKGGLMGVTFPVA